ncbi:hypothetical protein DL767_003568 [Monosporascus sp. MG133]|nr:hypothetical protein DL767_003568 [Monosporascus sp. MG133]
MPSRRERHSSGAVHAPHDGVTGRPRLSVRGGGQWGQPQLSRRVYPQDLSEILLRPSTPSSMAMGPGSRESSSAKSATASRRMSSMGGAAATAVIGSGSTIGTTVSLRRSAS